MGHRNGIKMQAVLPSLSWMRMRRRRGRRGRSRRVEEELAQVFLPLSTTPTTPCRNNYDISHGCYITVELPEDLATYVPKLVQVTLPSQGMCIVRTYAHILHVLVKFRYTWLV
jgi:hypothetical protein